MEATEGKIASLAESPDGMTLAIGGGGEEVGLLQASNLLSSGEIQVNGSVHSVDFSPDGLTLLICSTYSFYLADWRRGGAVLKRWESPYVEEMGLGDWTTRLHWAKFFPDQRLIVAGANFSKLLFFDSSSLEQVAEVEVGGEVRDLAFSPSGDYFAVTGGHEVSVWDASLLIKERIFSFPRRERGTRVAWSPTGSLIAYGDSEGHVRLVDSRRWVEVVKLTPRPGEKVESLAFSPDGLFLAFSFESVALVFSLSSLSQVAELVANSNSSCLLFSRDSRFIFIGGLRGLLMKWAFLLGEDA